MTGARVKSISDQDLQRRMFPDLAEKLIVAAAVCEPGFYTSLRNELRAADFQLTRHVELWAACARIIDAGSEVNVGTLALDLAEHGAPAGCDLAFLMDLDAAHVPVPDPAPYLAAIREAARHRRALALATKLRGEIELGGYDPQRVRATIDELEALEADTDGGELPWEPDLFAVAKQEIAWVVPRIIGEGLLTIIAADGGYGKSTLLLDFAVQSALSGRETLYIDCENPDVILAERLRRFNLTEIPPKLTIRGLWSKRQYEPGEPCILEWVKRRPGCLVCLDSLVGFLARNGLDENSPIEVRGWFDNGPRRLAALGAAVAGLAHSVKGGKGFRGTSEIKNSPDFLFELDNPAPGADLKRLNLRAVKRRGGADEYAPFEWDPYECTFLRRTLTKAETNEELCRHILQQNAGVSQREFREAAQKAGASYRAAIAYLKSEVEAGRVLEERRSGRGGGSGYTWIGDDGGEL